MEKNIHSLLRSILLFSITFAVLILSNCTEDSSREKHSYIKYYELNKEKADFLLKDYQAQVFNCSNFEASLKHLTLIDSTIINFTKRDDSYFIKAQVRSNCGKKVYAALKCSQKFYDEYRKSKSNHAYMVISLNKIDEISTTAEADTLDRNSKNIRIENSVMLSGNCIAFTEIPDYSSIY